MESVAYKISSKDEVLKRIESWRRAVESRDVYAIASHYAPDVVAFDAIAQLQFKGRDAYMRHWQTCFSMCQGAMIFELHELSVTAGNDLAFCHCLCRCGTSGEDGEEKAGWTRATMGCRKINGRWLISHDHFSAPFDPASGKALFDLQQ